MVTKARVIEVYVPADRSVGSGYLLTPHLVLTACHVIAAVRPTSGAPAVPPGAWRDDTVDGLLVDRPACRVRSLGAPADAFADAVVVWWDPATDVALLVTREIAPLPERDLPGVQWADLEESDAVEATAVGFPQADVEGEVRESRQLLAEIAPLSGTKAGRWLLHVRGTIGTAPLGSAWAGMSGAAVFAGDALIGVVRADADPTAPERLELWAVPARMFAGDARLCEWCRWDGGAGAWQRAAEAPVGSDALLRRIAEANARLPVLGNDVVDKLIAALAAQRDGTDQAATRRAVGRVLAMLRSKNVLYAELDNEIWKFAFASLRELRDALAEASAELSFGMAASVQTLVDLMLTAVRDYLGRHEAAYVLFMAPNPNDARRERDWPEASQAALDLLALREVLVAAIQPLNAFAADGEGIAWTTPSTVRAEEAARPLYGGANPVEQLQPGVDTLASALGSEVQSVRLAALERLVKMSGSEATGVLVGLLGDPDGTVAARAAAALAQPQLRPSGQHVPALRDIALREGGRAWRAAHELLIPFAGEDAIAALFISALADGITFDRDQLLAAIPRDARDHPGTLRVLVDGSDWSGVCNAFRSGDAAARRAVLGIAASHDHLMYDPFATREYNPYAIHEQADLRYGGSESRQDRPVSDLLADAVEDPDRKVRFAAVRAVWFCMGVDGYSLLIKALDDPEAAVRARAIYYLSGVATPESAELALISLEQDPDERVRGAAAEALAETAEDVNIPVDPIVAALKDPSSHVRAEVVSVLQAIAPFDEVPVTSVLAALDDPESNVRSRAARLAGMLHLEAAVPRLDELVQAEEEWWNRDAMFHALHQIGNEPALRCIASETGSSDGHNRFTAASTLIQSAHPAAASILTSALKARPADKSVAIALVGARRVDLIPVLEAAATCAETEAREILNRRIVEMRRGYLVD